MGIIPEPPNNSPQPPGFRRSLILDTAENLQQISTWATGDYSAQQRGISLFMTLTRKNLDALCGAQYASSNTRDFTEFCRSFDKLEDEYRTGIQDHAVWANALFSWSKILAQKSHCM